jgi:hypothetical protein
MFISQSTSGVIDRDNGRDHMRDQFTLQVCREGDGQSGDRLRRQREIERQLFHARLLAEGLRLLPGG